MPIYEYHCDTCAKDFEQFQSISDEPLKKCPNCQGIVKRIVSRTSFTLKGSGWYRDGYSSKQKETSKPETKPESGKSETKTTSEKKPPSSTNG